MGLNILIKKNKKKETKEEQRVRLWGELKKQVFKYNVYRKLSCILMRKGLKMISNRFVIQIFTLLYLNKKKNISIGILLATIFKNLIVRVEVRNLFLRGRIHAVPFLIELHRKQYLVLKWLLKSAAENMKIKNLTLVESLSEELLLVYKKSKDSKTLQLKNLNWKKSVENRANIHYRW